MKSPPLVAALVALALSSLPVSSAQAPAYTDTAGRPASAIGVICLDPSGNYAACGGASGSAPVNVTRTRLVCTLPAYAAGGNVVCTNEAGAQTTTACAANTACLIAAANPNRRTAEFTNRTAGSTIDLGYSATVAPGTGKGYDGPSATNGQGGSGSEVPAHSGTYYAASATAGAVLVFIQGQ